MPRTLTRTLTTFASTVLLLVLTALPALAASAGTKPDPATDPNLVGSMPQLGVTAIVGVVIGILAYSLLGKDTSGADEDH